jgi:hypothetical protein
MLCAAVRRNVSRAETFQALVGRKCPICLVVTAHIMLVARPGRVELYRHALSAVLDYLSVGILHLCK